MSDPGAGQSARRRRAAEPLRRLLQRVFCLLLVWTKESAALADFSGYLTKLLRNHTVYACDGDHLSLQCPRHSTISVYSAYYGQAPHLCSAQQPEVTRRKPLHCVASTTLQKVLDECQDLRACNLLVNSRVFGLELCPGITKYLLVSFKCKPSEYKTRSVCENEELKLHCQESKFLNIYAASYGRSAHEKHFCSTNMDHFPQFDCFSYSALEVLSKKCYGKQRCRIIANNHNFGRPCMPGVKKYLNVSYACVPGLILAAVDPMVTRLTPSWKPKEGYDINLDPRESRIPKKEGIIVSSSLATFAYIRDHLERAALLFVSSVCVGLMLTLCALGTHVSCSQDLKKLWRMKKNLVLANHKVDGKNEENGKEAEEEEGLEPSDSDSSDELTGLCQTPAYCPLDAAELAERIERREQIIQEIWMNSGLEAPATRSLTPLYINEQCICFR